MVTFRPKLPHKQRKRGVVTLMYWENKPIIICDHNYANDKTTGQDTEGSWSVQGCILIFRSRPKLNISKKALEYIEHRTSTKYVNIVM